MPCFLGDELDEIQLTKVMASQADGLPGSGDVLISFCSVDSVCINQKDLEERSHQVVLMREIYSRAGHVTMWVGEELPRTREAYHLLFPLRNLRQLLYGLVSKQSFEYSKDTEEKLKQREIADGTFLGDISTHPLWPAIVDLWTSRTVFQRLWTVQEIALAPEGRIDILCGTVSIEWTFFHTVAGVLLACKFCYNHLDDDRILSLIIIRRQLQRREHSGFDFLVALVGAIACTTMDDKDRVFAILGLISNPDRARLEHLNYSSSLEDISRAVMEISLHDDLFLRLLGWNSSVNVGGEDPDQPSWLLQLGEFNFEVKLPGSGIEGLESFQTLHSSEIAGPVLTARGFVFDTVRSACSNFSAENIKRTLLDFDHGVSMSNLANNIPGDKIDRFWPLLSFNEPDTWEESDRQFKYTAMIARLTLLEWADIPNKYKNESCEHSWRGRLLVDLEKETSLSTSDIETYWQWLREHLILFPQGNMGRNLFTSTRGYCGIGKFGKNHPGSEPAVQVGDKIAIFPRCNEPYIIRPCGENGEFTFIGPSFIPHISSDVLLRPENCLPLQEIRLR